jgi:tetratricopeptide (TPR) repeat protein
MKVMNWACMGRLQGDLGDGSLARELNGRARALALEMGDRWTEGLTMANVAQLDQEQQRFETAASLLEQSIERFRQTAEPHYVAVYSAALGDVLFEWGKLDEARVRYAGAEAFLGAWVAHRSTAMLYAAWAALEARCGERAPAAAYLDRAQRCSARQDSASVRLVVELHGASVELGTEGGASAVPIWRDRARAVAASEDARTSLDVRFAMRILLQALEPRSAPAGDLRIGPGAAWFARGDGGGRVDLRRRGALRRILAALVQQHDARVDVALDHDALMGHGWPGERLLPEAAGTRLRVAIATLRRLGLREIIVTRDDGYLLDPAVRVKADHV